MRTHVLTGLNQSYFLPRIYIAYKTLYLPSKLKTDTKLEDYMKNENSNIKKTETTFYNFQSIRKQHSL